MRTWVLRHNGRFVAAVYAAGMGAACRALVRMGHGNASAAQGYRLHARAPLRLAVG